MAMASPQTNASLESLVLGFSNLRKARSERPIVITRGQGVFIYDENGKDYLEATSSFYCAAFGYSEARLIEAAERQMRELPFYVSGMHRTVPAAMELADRLAALAPFEGAHVAFGSTGSEANDFIIKFMRYRNVFRGQPDRRKVISRWGSYHGGTSLTASLGGSKSLHDSFALDMSDHLFVSQPNYFTDHLDGESEAEFVARLARELEETILEAGPETVGAFIAEPVCFSCGFFPPPKGYFDAICEVLTRYGIAFIDDEVVTGFARTGNMFATETYDLKPDCMVSAKALSSAYFPISAIIMSDDFYGDLEAHSDLNGMFAHAGTYSAHPVGAAVALEVLNLMEERDMVNYVRDRAVTLRKRLDGYRDHPLIADVRALGLGGALQLKAEGNGEGATGTVSGLSKAVMDASMERGVIVRVTGTSVLFAPPLIITDAEIDEMFDRFDLALNDAEREVSNAA